MTINQRYINEVLWFGTSTGEQYGFIRHDDSLNDGIFFHKNQILEPSHTTLEKFSEDTIVIFSTRQSSKEKDKLEAYDVLLLADCDDINFLLDTFLGHITADTIDSTIFRQLKSKLYALTDDNNRKPDEKYKDKIKVFLTNHPNISPSKTTLLLELIAKAFAMNNATDTFIFETIIDINFNYLTHNHKLDNIKNTITNISTQFHEQDTAYHNIISHLKENHRQDAIHYYLWLDDLLDEMPTVYIAEQLFSLNNRYRNGFLNHVDEEHYELLLQQIVQKFIAAELQFEQYRDAAKFFEILSQHHLNSFIPQFAHFVDNNTKFELWINEKFDYLNFDDYKACIPILDNDHQKLAIKRLFNMAHKGLFCLEITHLEAVNATDYSTRVVIEIIKGIKKSKKINKNSLKNDVLRLIADIVSHSSDLLALDGYFDVCIGRTKESKSSEEYSYTKGDIETVSEGNPKAIICDGRLSVSKDGNVNLTDGGKQFWWCKNLPCLEAARQNHGIVDWKNYSIIDFLDILGITYDSNDIELLYATINKVNKFLAHLNCRSCQRILKPVSSSNHAFYRVSRFYCDNNDCIEDERIYISHCSNGYCEGVIDSRDVVQCTNDWYICESCFACCSTQGMANRGSNLNANRQQITQAGAAHRGESILCPKCGDDLGYLSAEQKLKGYQEALDTFNNLATMFVPQGVPRLVSNHGINRFKNKWFIMTQGQYSRQDFDGYLRYWQSLGFHIPDFPNDRHRTNYLISEPIKKDSIKNSTHFNCRTCDFQDDLSGNISRQNAVNYWHKI